MFLKALYIRVLRIYFHIIDLFYFKEAIRKICGQFIVEVREGRVMGVKLRLAVFTQQVFYIVGSWNETRGHTGIPCLPITLLSLQGKEGMGAKTQES